MKNTLKIGLIINCSLIFGACKKEPALNIDSNFIGNWKQISATDKFVYLQIESDSKGYIEYYENGIFMSDTQRRK